MSHARIAVLPLLLAVGCVPPAEELCTHHYAFEAGPWEGGEGSAPGGANLDDDGDDDDAAWDDDDAMDDDDAVDDDDYTGDDDDDGPPANDDDAADDDDYAGDDDDATWGDDDDATGDDDDSADVTNDEERDVPRDTPPDGFDAVCAAAPDEYDIQYLSADDSNSQADPSQHREMILHHGRVPTRAKAWEYLNYYDFDYPKPAAGTLSIVPEANDRPGLDGVYDLVVGVVAPAVTPEDRGPFNLVFTLDVSGSMNGAGIDTMQHSLRAIASSLRDGDFVSVVLWATEDAVVLQHHQVSGPDDAEFLDIIDGLVAGGGTNLDGGLRMAYDLAGSEPIAGTTNRVVLVSDGGANVGTTSANLIAQHAQQGDAEGIYLVGIGVPPANKYNDALMDQVTDLGRGAYLYVDSECEAERSFTPEKLVSLFGVAALDVQLQMTLPPGLAVSQFTGEQISFSPSEVVPQHLAPNDQMIYDVDVVDCSGATDQRIFFEARWRDPRTGEPRKEEVSVTMAELMTRPRERQRKAEALVAFAATFKAVASRDTAYAQLDYLDEMADYLADVREELDGDRDVAELASLIEAWQAMY